MMDKSAKSAGRVLLPTYTTPTKYVLNLTPDLKAYTFDGILQLHLTTSEDASNHKSITLHAKELMFKTAKITYGEKNVDAEEVSVSCVLRGKAYYTHDGLDQ
jgi:aminopeptidase N